MSRFGDLLELLHGARQRWQTVRLVVRRWHELERGHRAMERGAERARARGAGVAILRAGPPRSSEDDAEVPKVSESISRLWLDPDRDRVRIERSDPHGGFYSVRVGERWWSYHPISGAISNEDDPSVRIGGADEVAALLDPALLLGSLDLEVIGERTGAGRDGIVVRATLREVEDPHRQGHYLPEGADDFEVLVDVERGILLRLEARLDDGPFMILELMEVNFDEPFPDDVFVFQPPPGEQVRPHRDVYAPPEGMSVEEAVRRAPFTVLAPRRLPDGWQLNVLYMPGRDRPPSAPSVVMHLKDPTGLHHLRILEQAEALDDGLDWVEVDFEGERIFVWEPKGRFDGEIEAKLERHGTHARLTGNLDRTTLLEIANSLHASPPEIPLVDQ
jgi:outer membrane lipoprotein-sorting protein